MEKVKLLIIFLLLLFMNCSENNNHSIIDPEDGQDTETIDGEDEQDSEVIDGKDDKDKGTIDVKVMKWKDGHTAAVTITYDHGWGTGGGKPNEQISQDIVLEKGLVLDYELVTYHYENYPAIREDIRDKQLPLGIGFFGHGHKHIPHDELSFDDCFDSFSLCFNLMKEWGLNPKAYAYPSGYGKKYTTQFACQIAGFICARDFNAYSEKVYLCPDDTMEPDNWYLMPSIRASSVHTYPDCITNHAEMADAIEKALPITAWIILCYHSIGFADGYAYYPLEDFEEDMDTIAGNDFWCSNMDVIACYIKERSAFIFSKKKLSTVDGKAEYKVQFRDWLDNSIYDSPLTLDFTFNESFSVREMRIDPALNGSTEFEVTDNSIRLNVVPDEREYIMTLLQ
ncbi:hypothetical protein ACFL30_02170 [Candidatus Latescibacterota bacterium]